MSERSQKLVVISPDNTPKFLDGFSVKFKYIRAKSRKLMLYWLLLYQENKDYFKGADIIYARTEKAAIPPIIAKLLLKNKKLVVGHRWDWAGHDYRIGGLFKVKGHIKRIFEKHIFQLADRITVPTIQMLENTSKWYNIPKNKFVIVPNFVNAAEFPPKPNYLIENQLRIITIGRLHKDKNYPLFLKSIKAIKESGINVMATIIGKCDDGEKWEEEQIIYFAREHDLEIKIVPYVDYKKIPDLLLDHDVYLNTSKHEGHPKALLEAMCCGLPCVCTDVIGNNAVIDDSNGVLTMEDAKDIAYKIKDLYLDEPKRIKTGKKAREYVREKCSIDFAISQDMKAMAS